MCQHFVLKFLRFSFLRYLSSLEISVSVLFEKRDRDNLFWPFDVVSYLFQVVHFLFQNSFVLKVSSGPPHCVQDVSVIKYHETQIQSDCCQDGVSLSFGP